MDISEPLLPAEQQLLDAMQKQEPCELITPTSAPTADEMARWDDPSRRIRAEFLRSLLLHLHPDVKPDFLILRGGLITGTLDLTGDDINVEIQLPYCIVEGAQFQGTTFTRPVGFHNAVFTADAAFLGANFTSGAWFDSATFAGEAWVGAKFAEVAAFANATFTKDAVFGGAEFAGSALFRDTTFVGDAWFGQATFDKLAQFDRATFVGQSGFGWTRFAASASFRNTAFVGATQFDKAIFEGDAHFGGMRATSVRFEQAEFRDSELGPMSVDSLNLTRATFHQRARISVLCSTASLRDTQFRSGGHLQIRGADISAGGTEFLGPTVLVDPGSTPFHELATEPLSPPNPPVEEMARFLPHRNTHHATENARKVLIQKAKDLLDANQPTALKSLRLANVNDLVLSSVMLDDCRFAGAHGLDELRIDASCRWASTPVRRLGPFTRRRVIAEEREWRRRYATWDGMIGPAQPTPPAAEIAGIYRDLRKGLEDIKDEPGAADFYYGEMEMRRLGHRGKADRSAVTARSERWLLHAYWAVSGYGLRAWRAFAAVAVLILTATLMFFTVGVAEPSGTAAKADSVDLATGTINYPPQEPTVDGFGDALELAGRNSIALLRNPGLAPELTAAGTAADVVLRLLTPVLLGFGLLALRGRTKR